MGIRIANVIDRAQRMGYIMEYLPESKKWILRITQTPVYASPRVVDINAYLTSTIPRTNDLTEEENRRLDRLKAIEAEKGWSHEEISDKLHNEVKPRTVAQWFCGAQPIKETYLELLEYKAELEK